MAFVQDNMLPTFPKSSETENSTLNKRRRFAPNSIPIIESVDNSDILDHTFNSPLLIQLCQQSPSQHEIEAQLLQVGMRIRKSVNEGYKVRAFTPRPFFDAGRLSPQLQAALSANGSNQDHFSAGGLHNVGNMAMQPISTATFCGINLQALAHISNDRTSPVEEQKMWSYSTSHKRSLDDDSDSDDSQEYSMPQTPRSFSDSAIPIDYFNVDMDVMNDDGPMTQMRDMRNAEMLARKVARPKTRVRGMQGLGQSPSQRNAFSSMASEQQQVWDTHAAMMMSCGIETRSMETNDFPDAPFLQRREDVDMDCS